MLVISRKSGESVHIGRDVILHVTTIQGGRVRIAIEAPREVSIRRGELAAFEATPADEFIAREIAVA